MPEPEYTLGPWEIREAYIPGDGKHDDNHFGAAVFHIYQVGELLHYVAEIGQCSPNAKGNTRLIVTAPEMETALDGLLRMCFEDLSGEESGAIIEVALAALAKARGKADA